MTLILPRPQPALFQVVDGNALELILVGKPFQPEAGYRTVYRIRDRLRGSRSNIDYAQEHLIAIRHWQGVSKLGVYRYDEQGERPSELLASFRLERVQ